VLMSCVPFYFYASLRFMERWVEEQWVREWRASNKESRRTDLKGNGSKETMKKYDEWVKEWGKIMLQNQIE